MTIAHQEKTRPYTLRITKNSEEAHKIAASAKNCPHTKNCHVHEKIDDDKYVVVADVDARDFVAATTKLRKWMDADRITNGRQRKRKMTGRIRLASHEVAVDSTRKDAPPSTEKQMALLTEGDLHDYGKRWVEGTKIGQLAKELAGWSWNKLHTELTRRGYAAG